MRKFEIFNNDKLGKVRTIIINNEIWFVLTDICRVLDIKNTTQMVNRLDDDERSMFNIGRQGKANIINESGLYKVLFRSDKPEAKEFANWITKEVIPSIRKTGSYSVKPQQLCLPAIKEHKIIKKYYNGVPVMSIKDLSIILECSEQYIHTKLENKNLIHKNEMMRFKEENPNLSTRIAQITILYREEVINICKKMKAYNKVKNQILGYFDDCISDVGNKKVINVLPNTEVKKVELLLQALPHLSEEYLKNRVAIEVIKLVDNKILEEYKTDKLHMRFIDSTERIISMKDTGKFITTAVETDKPIEKLKTHDLLVTDCNGYKLIIQKK